MSECKFACPHCGQHLAMENAARGIVIQCPACAGSLQVPSAAVEPHITERPLSGTERIALVCGAEMTIILFYLFALGAILALLGVIALEFFLVLLLLRFGLARLILPHLELDLALLKIFLRGFKAGRETEYFIRLQLADAPGLF